MWSCRILQYGNVKCPINNCCYTISEGAGCHKNLLDVMSRSGYHDFKPSCLSFCLMIPSSEDLKYSATKINIFKRYLKPSIDLLSECLISSVLTIWQDLMCRLPVPVSYYCISVTIPHMPINCLPDSNFLGTLKSRCRGDSHKSSQSIPNFK